MPQRTEDRIDLEEERALSRIPRHVFPCIIVTPSIFELFPAVAADDGNSTDDRGSNEPSLTLERDLQRFIVWSIFRVGKITGRRCRFQSPDNTLPIAGDITTNCRMETIQVYPRLVEARVKEALSDTPVVLVVGPRRAGKTILLVAH